jgi:6-phosphofructokinase 1
VSDVYRRSRKPTGGNPHAIVVVAEGAKYNAEAMARYFKEHRERLGFDLRVTILGHVRRGGAPGVFDRLLATRFGAAATGHLARGVDGIDQGGGYRNAAR